MGDPLRDPTTADRALTAALVATGLACAAVAFAAMIGLGVHRHGSPLAVSLVATGAVFGPALVAASAGGAAHSRSRVLGAVLVGWSLALLAALPVYFPGERRQAVATGIALVQPGGSWEALARRFADQLPEEPALASPGVAEAPEVIPAEPLPPLEVADHEIALPYEGEGRRLAVPVAFEQGERTLETWMLLDTGATYTTLSSSALAALGITPSEADPIIRLHTANGEREARVVLLDRVWLGDLALEGIAIATCEACASDDTLGLLGLNVTGGYNLFIDADRREVVFTSRPDRDHRLDVVPFVDLGASFSRYPGGRVEVDVELHNHAPRAIVRARARVACREGTWAVELGGVGAGELTAERRSLPAHERCPAYEISLDGASW